MSGTPRADYLAAIDWLKAAAIVTVVWIHAFSEVGRLVQAAPPAIHRLSLFAVPAFFFASGFLYNRGRVVRWPEARWRLIRILVPYAFASVAGEAFTKLTTGLPITAKGFLFDLATGNALGIYYFVPVLALTIPLVVILSRWPRLLLPLLLFFLIAGVASAAGLTRLNLYWQMRLPLHWWGYFLVGWAAAPLWPRIASLGRRRRLLLCAAFWAVVLAFAAYLTLWKAPVMGRPVRALNYPVVYAVIFGIMVGTAASAGNRVVRWLSGASYPIYLYHFFFIMVARSAFGSGDWEARTLTWAVGLGGAVLFCLAGVRLLGPAGGLYLLGIRTQPVAGPPRR